VRQGPIPIFVHGIVDYAAAVLFIAAPFLFGFDSSSAKAVSIVVGVVALIVAATTAGPTGLAKMVSPALHVFFDFGLSIFLLAAPFLFGFSDEGRATAFFMVAGVGYLLLTIGTRYRASEAAA
jgi:hypothetical protein